MKISSILLAGLIGFSAISPAHAGGSMSREVSIIIVKPSYEVQAMNRRSAIRKEMLREAKERARAEKQNIRRVEREIARQRKEADKAYAKKLKAQRKAREK